MARRWSLLLLCTALLAGGRGVAAPRDVCAAARSAFLKLFKARSYREAHATLAAARDTCFEVLSKEDKGWVASDLAIAAHRMGDDEACLAALSDAPDAPGERLAEALGFNHALCGGPCNIYQDPGCREGLDARLTELRAQSKDRGYAAPPCAIPGRKGVAIAARGAGVAAACLQLLPAAGQGACPRLVVLEETARGEVHRKVLRFPGGSAADPSDCCNLASLAVAEKDGATMVRVGGAGRDCYGGTASWNYDVIYRWDGSALVLDHDNNFGFH